MRGEERRGEDRQVQRTMNLRRVDPAPIENSLGRKTPANSIEPSLLSRFFCRKIIWVKVYSWGGGGSGKVPRVMKDSCLAKSGTDGEIR